MCALFHDPSSYSTMMVPLKSSKSYVLPAKTIVVSHMAAVHNAFYGIEVNEATGISPISAVPF